MAVADESLRCPAIALASADGKFILVPFGISVTVYQALSGARIQQLDGHTRLVTAIALHQGNTHQVYTVSLDSTLRLWDFEDGILAKTFELEKPIYSLVVPRGQPLLLYEILKKPGDKGRQPIAGVKCFNAGAGSALEPTLTLNGSIAPLAASENGEFAAVADSCRLILWPVEKGWKVPLKLYHTKNLTSLAISAAGGKVSAGDCTGRILIWHNFPAALIQVEAGHLDGSISCTTVHWHSGPVRCLTFSHDSNYLLSGGDEAVLVAWQLGGNARRTLPRLNGQLLGVTALLNDAAMFLVTQRDNTVRIVNLATMKLAFSIHGLRRHPQKLPDQVVEQSAAAMLPGGGELVIAGDSTIIQFYDASRHRHLDKLQVRPVNAVVSYDSGEGKEGKGIQSPHIEPQVQYICFSADGTRMATVDVRPDISQPDSVYHSNLRFWESRGSGTPQEDAPLYQVHQDIDSPHRERLTGLAYYRSCDMAASISLDGELQLWELTGDADRKQRGWQCKASTSYQDESMHSVAVSADDSLLAVGTGSIVTLWHARNGSYLASLPNPVEAEDINFSLLSFVPGTPYLAGAMRGSREGLAVWNILTAAIWWWTPVAVTCLAADGLGTGCLAIGVRPAGGFHRHDAPAAGSVAIFNAASPKPIQVWYLPQSWATSIFFPPPSSPLFSEGVKVAPEGTSPLLILSHDRKYCIGRGQGAKELPRHFETASKDPEDKLGLSAYVQPALEVSEGKVNLSRFDTNPSTRIKVAALLDAPSHILPPMDKLAPAFLELLICEASEDSS